MVTYSLNLPLQFLSTFSAGGRKPEAMHHLRRMLRDPYQFCLLNFLGTWVSCRRVDKSEPLVPTPHTH
jgi:hypothetical protein